MIFNTTLKTFGVALGSTLLVLMNFSCNNDEFFELKAPPVTEWRTVADLELAISYPYLNTFVNSEKSIGLMTHFIHDLMSDMVRRIADNGGWQSADVYLRETEKNVSNVQSKYQPGYQTISACNFILEYLATDPFPNATEFDKANNINRIKGEALFLRGFAYYYLAQLFCPPYDPAGTNEAKVLVLRTEFANNLASALNTTRGTTEEVYQQVRSDFQEAKALLPKEWKKGMAEAYKYGRATKHVAAFYLAKTMLHMGDHTAALAELNSILDDPEKPRTLAADPRTLFTNGAQGEPFNIPEVIFYGFYSDALRTTKRHFINIYYFTNKTFPDPGDFRPWWLLSLGNDKMQEANIMVNGVLTPEWKADKRSQLWYLWKGAYKDLPNKKDPDYMVNSNIAIYVGNDDPVLMVNKYYQVPAPLYQNIPFIRSAEAYILRAAIKTEAGDNAGAAKDLDVVRERAWDTSISGPYVSLGSATFEDVDIEWIKELAFEGDRVSFLQMFRKPIGPAERNVAPILPPYEGMNWPIPVEQIDFE